MFRAVNSWQIDLALTKETKLTERVAMEFAVQAFNIFNHTQLADPGDLTLYYNPPAGPGQVGTLTPKSDFGIISTFVNYNINNDNAASPNTGTGCRGSFSSWCGSSFEASIFVPSGKLQARGLWWQSRRNQC